jgi:hypothetical protein
MHPYLSSALAAERRRDLAPERYRDLGAIPPADRPPSPALVGRPARSRALPRYHVSWTRTTLAAVADRQRARSLVIVISATRTR